MVRTKHLRWLGLRSLKEVSAGHVMIRDNTELCYLQRDQWTRLLKSSQQSVSVRNNAPPADCGELPGRPTVLPGDVEGKCDSCVATTERQNQTCDSECTDQGCWGPGPAMCVSCRHFSRGGRCVAACHVLQG